MKEETLEFKQWGLARILNKEIIDGILQRGGPEVNEENSQTFVKMPMVGYISDPIAMNFTVGFKATLPTKKLLAIRYPTTWWDAVKDRWVPMRLRKYTTINYKTVNLDAVISGIPMMPKGMGTKMHYTYSEGAERLPIKYDYDEEY